MAIFTLKDTYDTSNVNAPAPSYVGNDTLDFNVASGVASGTLTAPSSTDPDYGYGVIFAYNSTLTAFTITKTNWVTRNKGIRKVGGLSAYGYGPIGPSETVDIEAANGWKGGAILVVFNSLESVTDGRVDFYDSFGEPDPPAITATAGDWIFIGGGLGDDSPTTFTPPTGYTSGGFAVGGGGGAVACAYKASSSGGTENPGIIDFDTGSDDWTALTMLLRPI